MDFSIETLGPRRIKSPIKLSNTKNDFVSNYVDDLGRIIYDPTVRHLQECTAQNQMPKAFEIAGPREMIYFDPSKVNAAVVTCGGLCPGINDVIRSLVMELWYWYGVRNIIGIKYGFRGFLPEYGYETVNLTPDFVTDIHNTGGTILGSARGAAKTEEIVDSLERMNIRVLFTIGGDGTQKGSLAIHEEAKKRGLKLAVVGIPKTIDNDIMFVDKTFGFETAFSTATDAVRAAHTEAQGAYNGIGLVKLMGRDSGFIAAMAALATHDVTFVLVPEVPFHLDGPNGFLKHLQSRLERRHHAVICVAEGAGQEHIIKASTEKDASGNIKYGDIGLFLKDKINSYLNGAGMDFTLKYIDPSYIIRSAPAIPSDSIYCAQLGQNAVHAAMAGKTGLIVGSWNNVFTHVPISAIISDRKKIDPDGLFWLHVLESTGQPLSMLNK